MGCLFDDFAMGALPKRLLSDHRHRGHCITSRTGMQISSTPPNAATSTNAATMTSANRARTRDFDLSITTLVIHICLKRQKFMKNWEPLNAPSVYSKCVPLSENRI